MGRPKKKLAPQKWKRVLYLSLPLPDNYTDQSFLSQMKKNINQHDYTWFEVAFPLCSITLELCCTVLFVLSFIYLDNSQISPYQLFTYSGIFVVMFCCFHMFMTYSDSLENNKNTVITILQSGVVLLSCGYLFSPILRTLTETISTDTVYAMVVVMLFIHITLQDYFPGTTITYSCLSLNSALFAAVCLASRLSTAFHTFSLITFAAETFIFIPCLRFAMQNHPGVLMSFTVTMVFITSGMLLLKKTTCAVFFFLFCSFINLYCPWLFVKYQVYKQNIYGPWDEAVIGD